jgi:TonB family protein
MNVKMTMTKIAMKKLPPTRPSTVCLRHALSVVAMALVLSGGCFKLPTAAQETARKVIAKTAPTYPELAKRMHVTGKVRLEVVVAASGTVKTARLVGGNPVFETNAVEAVKQWRFEAGPADTKSVIVVEFADQ